MDLKDILENFRSKRILVIGDYYLDEYVTGEADKLSPEAPVLRMSVKNTEHVPGAAANVAVGFAALGAVVYSCGVTGDDNYGRILRDKLMEKHVNTKGLISSKERNTGVFSRIVLEKQGGSKQHVIRVDIENEEPVSKITVSEVKRFVEDIVREVDCIFIADYDESPNKTGLVSKDLLSFCLEQAKMHNIMTVGISRLNIADFKRFDVVLMNEYEATNILGKIEQFEDAAKKINYSLGTKIALLTKGRDGLVAARDDETISLPSFAKKVVDVCGAGDSLAAAFTLGLLSGAGLKEAAIVGSVAASAAIGKQGTYAVTISDIRNSLLTETDGKIKNLIELKKVVQEMKQNNKKIVFTNGCFDLIHPGQIQMLEKAKEFGDCLIVGINSDQSVRENKGNGRPILLAEDRLKILSALRCVDYVTIFDELTPIKLISTIQPDILVKGGAHSKDTVVGKDIVESYGGRVEIIPSFRDVSADKLIEAIVAGRSNHENSG